VELVAVTVTERVAVSLEVSLTDDWLVATAGGFALPVIVAVILTSPLRCFRLVTVTATVPA
jgi:hypothetical protein